MGQLFTVLCGSVGVGAYIAWTFFQWPITPEIICAISFGVIASAFNR